jgi:hypothetical protein
MTISERVDTLEGFPVVDWSPGQPVDPARGLRLRVEYGAGDLTAAALVAQLAETPGVEGLPALVIGQWSGELYERGPDDVLDALLAARDRFLALRHLFVGDILVEESEISWIAQCDYGPLLRALPKLETLGVRGGGSLAFSDAAHDTLRSLTVQTGGLGRDVLAQIARAKLPALEHLELWLGDPSYGGDATADDVLPFLSGRLFPRLRYLGLRDSMAADAVAVAVANSPALAQIEALDLSMGALGDEGGEALLASPHVAQLKSLNLAHHFMSEDLTARLAAKLGAAVDVSNRQTPSTYGEESYRFVEVAE